MPDWNSDKMPARWFKDEHVIVLTLFVLGFLLRITNLSAVPFNSTEALNALDALSVSRFSSMRTAASPIYQSLSAINFYLFRATPFFARFWPALAGSSLALVPLLWRKKLGSLNTLLLAGALAFDPVLVTLSRQADGAIFTVVGLIWALTFFRERKPLGFGILLAVAWLSGPWFWISGGVSILGVGLYALSQTRGGMETIAASCPFRTKNFRNAAALSFFVSIVVLSTGFFLNPAGISGAAGGLARFWSSTRGTAQLAPTAALFRLIAYSIPVIMLAIPAVLSAWREKSKLEQVVSLLAGLTLIAILLFRRQGAAGFALLHVLLWFLAIDTLQKQIQLVPEHKNITLGAFILAAAICGYLALSLRNLVNPVQTGYTFGQSAIAFILGLLLLLLVFVLIMLGWSLTTARKGILSAVMLGMMAFLFSLSFLSLKTSNPYPALVWSDSTLWVSAGTQQSLLREIEKLGKLEPQITRVAITDPELESLSWEFRDYQNVAISAALPESSAPGIILSNITNPQNTADSYRGVQLSNPGKVPWGKLSPTELLRSAIRRKLPVENIEYILWIRQDLMTGALP